MVACDFCMLILHDQSVAILFVEKDAAGFFMVINLKIMRVQLTSVSPVTFMIAKEGDIVTIQHRPPRLNEYREKIGAAAECYLVFKGKTKIGMIPKKFAQENKKFLVKKNCRIVKIDHEKAVLVVELAETIVLGENDEIKSS